MVFQHAIRIIAYTLFAQNANAKETHDSKTAVDPDGSEADETTTATVHWQSRLARNTQERLQL